MLGFKTLYVFIDADACGYCKSTDIIFNHRAVLTRIFWCNKICDTTVWTIRWFCHLLTQVVQYCFYFCPIVIRVKLNVITHTVCREETDHRSCLQPFLIDDLFQHLLRIFKQTRCFFTDDLVI